MELTAENVQCFLIALGEEAKRRGEMFPQTEDCQRSDSSAIHQVCQVIKFYEKTGYPREEDIDHWIKLRTRNRQFQRERQKE